jgi:hypothetical protein
MEFSVEPQAKLRSSVKMTISPSLGQMSRELSVGEVAARSGVAVSTIHFYESKGLIKSCGTMEQGPGPGLLDPG